MRHIVFIFTLCLLVVSAYAGTYVETFDDRDLGGWKAEGPAKWNVVDGVLTARSTVSSGSGFLFGSDDWRNYTLECDARIVEPIVNLHNASIGLRMLYRNINDFNYIWCVPSPPWGTAFIWVWMNGREIAMSAQKPFKQEINRWYHLKGVAHEDSFEFYIDGELMASMSDSRFPTGHPMLQVNGCLAHFDNVVITGDDVPDNSLETAAVSAIGRLATTWGQLRSK